MLLLLVPTIYCQAEGRSLTTDGVFWAQKNDSLKVAFLVGYSAGYRASSTDVGQTLIDQKEMTAESLRALIKNHDPELAVLRLQLP